MSNERDVSEARPVFHAAECWHGCDDPGCPYMHWDSWAVGDEHYRTEDEATAALRLAKGES